MSAFDRPKGLKPCPFCRSENLLAKYSQEKDVIYACVQCQDCEAEGPYSQSDHCVKSRMDAIEAWNYRPFEDRRII